MRVSRLSLGSPTISLTSLTLFTASSDSVPSFIEGNPPVVDSEPNTVSLGFDAGAIMEGAVARMSYATSSLDDDRVVDEACDAFVAPPPFGSLDTAFSTRNQPIATIGAAMVASKSARLPWPGKSPSTGRRRVSPGPLRALVKGSALRPGIDGGQLLALVPR